MKICPVVAGLFHADGRPDMVKLIVLFAIMWICLIYTIALFTLVIPTCSV